MTFMTLLWMVHGLSLSWVVEKLGNWKENQKSLTPNLSRPPPTRRWWFRCSLGSRERGKVPEPKKPATEHHRSFVHHRTEYEKVGTGMKFGEEGKSSTPQVGFSHSWFSV